MNYTFIKACKKEQIAYTPIWIMRQAGRYLPEYRKIREKYDFISMYKTPSVASEVTVQPVEIIGVDAAILFSDILVIPEAMGMKLIFEEKRGPFFPEPIREEKQIQNLIIPYPEDKLNYVMKAIDEIKRNLQNRVPLIGFSGSPWTLCAYMIEGQGNKDFKFAKTMLYNEPKQLHTLLEKISQSVFLYLEGQIESGADAIQIFDTWAEVLSKDDYIEFSLNYVKQIIQKLKGKNVPIIFFSKGTGHLLKELSEIDADVISLDWKIDIREAKSIIGEKVALQGNLDPVVLYSSFGSIKKEIVKILEKFGKGSGHIFNLGHGISPDVEVEKVKFLVQTVHEESKKFHL
jgi:uroporphyrinogen decarboxylase